MYCSVWTALVKSQFDARNIKVLGMFKQSFYFPNKSRPLLQTLRTNRDQ